MVKRLACGMWHVAATCYVQPNHDPRSSNFWHLFRFNWRVLSSLILGNLLLPVVVACCCCLLLLPVVAAACCCRSHILLCSWPFVHFNLKLFPPFDIFYWPALRVGAPVRHVATEMAQEMWTLRLIDSTMLEETGPQISIQSMKYLKIKYSKTRVK